MPLTQLLGVAGSLGIPWLLLHDWSLPSSSMVFSSVCVQISIFCKDTNHQIRGSPYSFMASF